MEPILSLKNVCSYYDKVQVLYDINVDVYPGEIVSVIGANGAGKSTMMKTIMGLVHMGRGQVTFDGKKLNRMHAHKICKAGIAYVPEGREVFPNMTVLENLEMGGYTRPNSELEESIENVYDHFPRLKERYKQVAGTLSGGEQQMLAMGRALMSKPKLMMMDEPSMGLAPILVEQIFDIIRELKRAGTTILLVEQNAQMALSIADRAYVLETGKIVNEGSASDLLHDDSVRRAYLGN